MLKRILIATFSLVSILAVGLYAVLNLSLGKLDGELSLDGLTDVVDVSI